MTPTPSPDPARYVSPVCRDGSHQACANFRGTCRCTCHAAAVEGTERPGGWVDGIGWVARLGDVADDDLIRHGEPISDPARDARRWYTPTVPVEVTRWADGSTPQPPAPERPDTAALLTIGDWLLRTLPGHPGAEQTAAALAYTARWIDAQPPVPPTPAPQADALEACDRLTDWLRATYDGSCRICGMGNEIVDQHADDCEAAPVLALATPPSTPVERPQPEPGALVLGPEDRFHLWTKLYGIQQEAGLCRFGGRNYDPRLDHIYEEVTTALAYFEPPAPTDGEP